MILSAALRVLIVIAVLASTGGTGVAGSSLYDDLGGRAGLERIVRGMLSIARSDPRTDNQFDNINFDWLAPRFTAYLCERLGGPCRYPGRDLHSAHVGLHVTLREYNAVVEDLQRSMDNQRIPFWTQNRLLALLAPTERDIVGP